MRLADAILTLGPLPEQLCAVLVLELATTPGQQAASLRSRAEPTPPPLLALQTVTARPDYTTGLPVPYVVPVHATLYPIDRER